MQEEGREATAVDPSPIRRLLPLVIPAIIVGVGSGLLLLGLTIVSGALEDVLWTALPDALGIASDSPGWIIGLLTVAGLIVGLVVTFVPGHAGPDPATTELAGPPLPLPVLPGLALAVMLTLASGVSLGPENPILAINIGLAAAIGARLLPRMPGSAWFALAFSGTIGAMFGTPLAAALLLSEAPDTSGRPLWDRLFGPLVAAAAGSMTMLALGGESFVLTVAPYAGPQLVDLVTGSVIAVGAAAAGMAAVYAFPFVHAAFHRLGRPILALVAGGFVLGVLGAIGGEISLFKGLEQMRELTETATDYTPAGLAFLAVIKLIAVLVASGSGFRGGRIFPSVFAGVAIGLFVYALFPQVPEAVALSASLIGILVAVTRSGWLAIFMGALMVGAPTILPVLSVIVLPAWLLVTGRPEMVVKPRSASADSR
ncbi:MAG TPA: ion channel protein [Candidatus Limnocylindrales bacterium]|nr:ion channel protein [Candidatus Limnocylindrales bacterium]